MLRGKTRVLIVGAGPVGMVAGLVLARNGVKPTIIDSASRTTTHSYACALHPTTLDLFSELGLHTELLDRGQKIRKIGFYSGESRQGEVDLSHVNQRFPFALVLAQSSFEQLLEETLAQKYGVRVNWRHRLLDLEQHAGFVTATIDRRGKSARGYVIAETEDAIQETFSIPADFVIGADGYNSRVRAASKIELVPFGEPKKFAMCEFETNISMGEEARICLNGESESALWPVSSHRCRWTFELPADVRWYFPKKERNVFVVKHPVLDGETRDFVMESLAERASWFRGSVEEIEEFDEAQFQPVIAARFGKDRCWLIGEAAHQSDPIGGQSLNIGLYEAADLATRIAKILHGDSPYLLSSYEKERREHWNRLLSTKARPQVEGEKGDWLAQHSDQLLSCVPASGSDFTRALNDIGLAV